MLRCLDRVVHSVLHQNNPIAVTNAKALDKIQLCYMFNFPTEMLIVNVL